jgi:adenylyltransferase/sulfurtransferase
VLPGDPFTTDERYHRQMLLPWIGADGQRRLRDAHALVVGCGALGCAIVDALARAGVGTLTIVDRDVVEVTNLQRQVLFDERHAADGVPKAEAAKTRVAAINRNVKVDARVEDFGPRVAEARIDGVDVILDGLDNFETRYLLNDLAVKHGVPYVYGGAVGTTGVALAILPHPDARSSAARPRTVAWTAEASTPCLRCVFPEPPAPGTAPTCDTAGVLGPVVALVAAHQSAQALKLLAGAVDAVDRALVSVELWTNETRRFDVSAARSAACPCCGAGTFAWLEGAAGSRTTALCGRNAVQISPPPNGAAALDLAAAATRLAAHGTFVTSDHLLRGVFARERSPDGRPIELMLFHDGRAIIKGTPEPEAARSIYARYVGT